MTFPTVFVKPLVDFVLKEIAPAYKHKKAMIRFEEQILPAYLNRIKDENIYVKTFLHRSKPEYLYKIYQETTLEYYDKVTFNDDITRLFDNTNYISISGAAGSGKSILMNHFLLTCLTKRYGIPIKIHLRNVNDKNFSIEREIQKLIYIRNPSSELIKTLLVKGKFIILFDGYDEISFSSLEKFNKNLISFISNYSENKYIMTSRPYSGADNLPRFHAYTIKKYSIHQVKSFVEKQVANKEICNNIIFSIEHCDQQYIQSYLTNPLILSIFILISRKTTKIPTKQHLFYRRVIDTLFEEHDALSKLGHVRELQSNLSQEEIERILQLFSIFSYFSQRFSFDKKYFFKQLNRIKKLNTDNQSIVSINEFDNKKLLYDLKVNVSLLKDTDGLLYFLHRSLQEYFIVSLVYNLDRYDSKKIMYEKMLSRIKNRKSYEIHTLTSLFEEMDKSNYYKYLLKPSVKTITRSIMDNSIQESYLKFLQFIVKEYVIRYDKHLQAYDNYVTLDHTWLFAIESLPSFNSVTNKIKKLLIAKGTADEIGRLKNQDKISISRILLKNTILSLKINVLIDEIMEYNEYINDYINTSKSFNSDVINML